MSENINESIFKPIESEVGGIMAEVEKEDRQRRFNGQIEKMGKKILELEQSGGQEYLINIMREFLNAALEMRDVMDALETTTEGMKCITEVIKDMDQLLDVNNLMMEETTAKRYTWWERVFVLPFRRRRALRNQRNRIKAISDNMKVQLDLVRVTIKELGNLSASMTSFTGKKQDANTPSKADAYLQELRGGNPAPTGGAPSSTAATPAPSGGGTHSSGVTDTGIDDL